MAAAAAFLLICGSFLPAEAATLRPLDPDGLNVRAGPGTEYAVIGGLTHGESAVVLGKEGDWYRVRLASGAEGWVAGWYSRVLLDDEVRYAYVNTDVLNVRREPSLSAAILTRLVQGQYVRLLEMIPEWWRVRLDDGTEGWVAAQYMAKSTTPPPTQSPGADPQPGTGAGPGTGAAPGAGTVTPSPAAPPPAPDGTVPDLAVEPPQTALPLPGKSVLVRTESGVYAGPNSEARRVDTVWPGESLRLLGTASGWVRVETPRARRGWIPGSRVQVQDGRLLVSLTERSWALEAPPAPGEPAQTGHATPPAQPPQSAHPPGQAEPGAPAPDPGASYQIVRHEDGLPLRLVPATGARVLATLPRGEVLEVLGEDGVWLKVKTAAGLVGWVHGGYTLPYGDGAQEPPASPLPPAVSTPSFKVSMVQPFPGASRLVVEVAGGDVGKPVMEGGVLTIPFATGEAQERTIPLNLLGVRQVRISPSGLALDLVGEQSVQVEEAASGRVSVLLRPILRAIAVESVEGNALYRFQVSGETLPSAREAGGEIIVDIPGAVLTALIEGPGLRAVQHATGVRVAIPSQRAFALKRFDQGYGLVVYQPGLAGKTILLDPGHGGDDPGAVSGAAGVVEKEVNLEVALRVRALLEAKGARVYMTRADDRRPAPDSYLTSAEEEPREQLDLQYRTLMANKLKVDLFLSIHHNAGEPGTIGTETYYTATTLNGERSRTLAHLIQEEVVAAVGTRNRGAKDDTFFVTRNTEAPAALLEVAFVTDPAEGRLAKDSAFQEAVAQAIVRALERFYAERSP